jgi:hypothetical protein
MSKPRSVDELLPLATNFNVSQAERVRALEGLPAHLRRLGRIEELTNQAMILAAKIHDGAATIAQLDEKLAVVNRLLDLHNRYYPIEANLPIDRRTGLSLDGDEPFRARPPLLREELLRGARR